MDEPPQSGSAVEGESRPRSTPERLALEGAVGEAWAGVSGSAARRIEVTNSSAGGAICTILPATSEVRVIAKVRELELVMSEAWIFQRVLPQLSVPRLECHGFAPIQPGMGVLFLEDVGDHMPDRENPAHAELAGEWLAQVHVGTSGMPRPPAIATHGIEQYQGYRKSAVLLLESGLGDLPLSPDQVVTMRRLIELLESAESVMPQIAAVAGHFPSMLVHGDFMVKNMRIRRRSGSGIELLPFDWEAGGWGAPLPDISRLWRGFHQLGWDRYVAQVVSASDWGVGEDTLREGARAGRILRLIAAVSWAAMDLSPDSLDQIMRDQIIKFESDLFIALSSF